MNELIKITINKYFRYNDTADYLSKCKRSISIPTEVELFFENNNIKIMNTNYGEVWPSSKIIFEYKKFIKGEFEVKYSSTLLISKLAPVCYLQHEFQIENQDVNRTVPTLEGFDLQPYCSKQQELENVIKNIFSKKGYIFLSYSELNEVICSLDYNRKTTFFGPQLTVEHVMFFDVLDLCPE